MSQLVVLKQVLGSLKTQIPYAPQFMRIEIVANKHNLSGISEMHIY